MIKCRKRGMTHRVISNWRRFHYLNFCGAEIQTCNLPTRIALDWLMTSLATFCLITVGPLLVASTLGDLVRRLWPPKWLPANYPIPWTSGKRSGYCFGNKPTWGPVTLTRQYSTACHVGLLCLSLTNLILFYSLLKPLILLEWASCWLVHWETR